MSDNDKTPKPDRAGSDDFEVPAFSPDSGGSTRASTAGGGANATENLYSRTGRAAPQNIPPKQTEPQRGEARQPESQQPEPQRPESRPFSDTSPADEKTTGVSPTGRNSQPLQSDAPTSSFERPAQQPQHQPAADYPDYADNDFAQPNNQQPAGQQSGAGSAPTGLIAAAPPAAQPGTEAAPVEAATEQREHRRGTIDFGLLMIRLLLGGYLVLAAVGTFFQLGDTPGLSNLESEYAAYTVPNILAIAVPSMQLAAGVFLLFGLITPVFAAIATIVTSFTALHALTDSGAGLNVFAWEASVMLSVVLLVISLALQFTGPGLYSLDFGRKWARRPLLSSWIFVILGIAGAVALWWFGAGVNPLN